MSEPIFVRCRMCGTSWRVDRTMSDRDADAFVCSVCFRGLEEFRDELQLTVEAIEDLTEEVRELDKEVRSR